MTYVPVDHQSPPETTPRKSPGRPRVEIPAALAAQLAHSAATGARCVIDRDGTEQEAAEIAELRRAIKRARYQLYAGRVVRLTVDPDTVSYWVETSPSGGTE